MDVCPLCGGSGKKIHVVEHKQTKLLKTSVEWCLCTKSTAVSESSYNPILSFLGNSYLPLDEIDKHLLFDPNNLTNKEKNPNLFIYNTTFRDFCYHLKSIIIKYKFNDPNPLIYCCRAIDILHKFYVAQEDGSCQHLSGVNKFDLLVFTLDTKEKNDQLNTCVAQVVYSRICCAKPTWLYIPYEMQGRKKIKSDTDLDSLLCQCKYEKSKDLEEYIRVHYKKIVLKPTKLEPPPKDTETRAMATNFTVTTVKENKPIEKK